jgi:hypothetical protein
MPAKDDTTREYLKAWGQKDVPTGLVTDGLIRPGFYPAFALLGWAQERPNRWPVVVLHLALMRHHKVAGRMVLTMPFTPKTDRRVCLTVENFGWDGRVWPHVDHGWPEGTDDETPLLDLLKGVNLGATLTFPPNEEQGVRTLRVFVSQRAGSFSTAPFHGAGNPRRLETLRELAKDPSPFKSDWANPT